MGPRLCLGTALWALLPPRCLLCGAAGAPRRDLCALCHGDLPTPAWPCSGCGRPQPAPTALGRCGACLRRPPPWDDLTARCRYGDPADLLVTQLKFGGRTAAARVIAELMVERPPADLAGAVLVPVPLHAARRRQRGFDQAERIAGHVARDTGLPLRTDLLRRARPTAPQARLGRGERRRNLAGAFVLRTGPVPETVVLVDDVLTTGASAAAATRVLRRAGVRRIRIWVFARTPDDGS